MRRLDAIQIVIAAGLLVSMTAYSVNAATNRQKKSPQSATTKEDKAARQTKTGNEAQAESSKTEVPAHDIDIIACRPTSDSVTLSVLAYRDMEGFISYGTKPQNRSNMAGKQHFAKNRPVEIVIRNLRPDTQYYYIFSEITARDMPPEPAIAEGAFHTQRAPGSAFTFTVTADSHLDQRTDIKLYEKTLSNAAADKPDFHVDLGDTFMTEKHASREDATQQYQAQRYYFGQLCNSASLFLAIGNHDGESSRLLDGTAGSLGVWSNMMRKRYFPNPVPDAFYSGNATPDIFAGALQDYYAWQWGDALFVVLDPYWFDVRARGKRDNWSDSLGEQQYQWLRQTLEGSKVKFKFVFIHQLVGGMTNAGRGGVEAAGFFEWGGKNDDGADGFKVKRPLWPEPIHQLLVRNHVSAVFHGHDHLFAKQDLDGIVYQEVPQPGLSTNMKSNRAAEYGYTKGTILGGTGHIRVNVSADKVTVDYISASQRNESAFSYTITAR